MTRCGRCNIKIVRGEERDFNSRILCEDCYIDIRTPRVRKTHWQYLKSKKAEYLIPSKND